MKKALSIVSILSLCFGYTKAQTLTLAAIIDSIQATNPVIKMYDNEVRSMDEAAKGARSWMAPQFGVGQFMTPYNVALWHREGNMPGMGSVMVSGEQMFPNKKKLDADEAYMKGMSSVENEKKSASLNDLISEAKASYYEWIILKKKIKVVDQNESLLEFMIKNAELRYKNGLGKISAYYKAKAALGNMQRMRVMLENGIEQRMTRINTLIGRNAATAFDIDTTYQLNDYSSLIFDSTLFYNNRSDLKAIDKDIMLTRLKQQTELQSLRPQFGIRYDHMIGFGGQPMQYTIMGMVKLPMAKWSSKMNKANAESLKWKASALQSQKEMMANEYSGMAHGMRTELEASKRQLKLYEDNIIPALRNNYKTMQLGYEQNTEELFMLYDAWEALNMIQFEYLEVLNEALRTQVSIERLTEKK